ncbi:MAG TPA: PDZ domain-containing protein, partial [Gammaproteobacteria bacterium]|nr:PDZ domain-containing protein [Gammaproteobacteria bacterium]
IPGDIILRIGEQPVSNPQEAIERIARMQPGKTITLMILRGWKEMQLTARVAVRPSFMQPSASSQ